MQKHPEKKSYFLELFLWITATVPLSAGLFKKINTTSSWEMIPANHVHIFIINMTVSWNDRVRVGEVWVLLRVTKVALSSVWNWYWVVGLPEYAFVCKSHWQQWGEGQLFYCPNPAQQWVLAQMNIFVPFWVPLFKNKVIFEGHKNVHKSWPHDLG